MLLVLDTCVLVAAVRSTTGASAEIVRRSIVQDLRIISSVPLFFEYEAVLTRPEQLTAANTDLPSVLKFLAVMASVVKPVTVQFLWRPILRDFNDDMVLETAVNGRATHIITLNLRDFLPHSAQFGLEVVTPSDFLKGLNRGNQ
jgi:putative PIN family toxin of toxin-antitoxin system